MGQGPEDRSGTAEGGICVVLNERSGRQGSEDREETLKRAFDSVGAGAEIRRVHKGGDLPGIVRRAVGDGFGTIVAAGGDGTISAVASQMRGTGRRMGIVPLGTFNYFARSLDLPVDPDEAVRIVVRGRPRPTRIATINDAVFLNNASLGAYPEILRARETIYDRWGRSRIAAYWSVLKTLVTLHRPLQVAIVADGRSRSFRTPLVFAVNNAYQLDDIGLLGREAIARGELVLLIAPDAGRLGTLRHAATLALGRARRHVDFEILTGRDIRIETAHRTRLVARDGERTRMSAPFLLKVHQDALHVMVPQDARDQVR